MKWLLRMLTRSLTSALWKKWKSEPDRDCRGTVKELDIPITVLFLVEHMVPHNVAIPKKRRIPFQIHKSTSYNVCNKKPAIRGEGAKPPLFSSVLVSSVGNIRRWERASQLGRIEWAWQSDRSCPIGRIGWRTYTSQCCPNSRPRPPTFFRVSEEFLLVWGVSLRSSARFLLFLYKILEVMLEDKRNNPNRPFLECATTSSSKGCRGDNLNMYLAIRR